MDKPKIFMTIGIPGSGKSTWAKTQVGNGETIIVSNDDLRVMFNNSLWQTDSTIRNRTESFVSQSKEELIALAIKNHTNVIVDATHISKKYEDRMRELFADKAEIVIKDFTDVPVEDCIKNDLKRPNSVGSRIIYQMYDNLMQRRKKEEKKEEPELLEARIPLIDPNLPDAIIVDMDGTLANIDWRNPYDASSCDEDGIYRDVEDLVKTTIDAHGDWILIILSGRMEQFKGPTVRWLDKYEIPYTHIYMRQDNDYRKDSIIKQEIYEDKIQNKYNVKFVLDDRNQVVDMWRGLGLRCLQVQSGDF